MLKCSLSFALLVGFATGCGSTKTCSPDTCQGCCDTTGVCKLGEQNNACGSGGNMCASCPSTQTCVARVCVASAVDGGTDAGLEVDAGTPLCGRTPVVCSDQVIQKLALFDVPNPTPGAIVDTAEGAGFASEINATAGGLTPTLGFVYARFTPTGLQQVTLSDTQALDSLDWDIAFRRYIMRLNSGDSGPACTKAAVVSGTFESISGVPTTASWGSDDYLSADCSMFHNDGFGLSTAPLTALTPYYEYLSCVKMTRRVFVIRTRAGKDVKFTVQRYYQNESGQQQCDSTGMSPGASAPGARLRVRWQFLN